MPTKDRKKTSKTEPSSPKKEASSSKPKKKKSSSTSSSSKREHRSKSPRRTKRSADKEEPASARAPTPEARPPLPSDHGPKASSDFEAGLLFQRFARNGGVDAKDFQRLWREMEKAPASTTPYGEGTTLGAGDGRVQEGPQRSRREAADGRIGSDKVFEFGQLFQKCDTDGDGRLGRADFDRIMRSMLEGLRAETGGGESSKGATAAMGTRPSWTGDAATRVRALSAGGGAAAVPDAPGTAYILGFQSSATERSPTRAKEEAPTSSRDFPPPPSAPGGPSITHYDETTGVPLTREAVASQQSLGHTVVPLSEAYTRRLSRLQSLASSRLMPVREQLLQLRRRFHSRADEVKAAKAAVERETLADAGAIVERLRSVEALKQATLAQGVNSVTAELQGVEKLAEQVTGITGSPTSAFAPPSAGYPSNLDGTEKMVELIQSYPELCNSIERVANRPFEANIDVRADDFPHETAERLEVLRRADRYEHALGVKDHMLWVTMQESQGLQDRCEEERTLGQNFADEAQEWVTLAGNLSDRVNTLTAEAEQVVQLREENDLLLRDNQELARRVEALEEERLNSGGHRSYSERRRATTAESRSST